MSMKIDMPDQKTLVLSYLKTGAGISAVKAQSEFACFRLAAVIHRLRRDGWRIVSKSKKSFTARNYTEYYLI